MANLTKYSHQDLPERAMDEAVRLPVGLAKFHVQPTDLDHKCQTLVRIRPNNTFLPTDPRYEEARGTFWTRQQSEMAPRCVFQPLNTDDVAIAMRTVTKLGCPFAIKSGGHASFAGASSTSGVLIDLVKLNYVSLEADQKSVKVGPGCRWIDVYPRLEPLGITVLGGRDANVGVGGFLLGGMPHLTKQ